MNYLTTGIVVTLLSPLVFSLITNDNGHYPTLKNDTPSYEMLFSVNEAQPTHSVSFFEATMSDNGIRLQWKTEDVDIDYFELEHSVDGISFKSLAKIKKLHSDSANRDYFFTDQKPTEGKNYYRLDIVGLDNTRSKSNMVLQRYNK